MNWDDDDFGFDDDLSDEEREELEKEMREKDEKRRNHPLVKQAKEIFETASALLESMPERDRKVHGLPMLESAMTIRAKLAGAMGSGSRILCLQNAAIIRDHGHYLLISTSGLKEYGDTDTNYVALLREEILRFRSLFVEWIKDIRAMPPDELEDEWGLF